VRRNFWGHHLKVFFIQHYQDDVSSCLTFCPIFSFSSCALQRPTRSPTSSSPICYPETKRTNTKCAIKRTMSIIHPIIHRCSAAWIFLKFIFVFCSFLFFFLSLPIRFFLLSVNFERRGWKGGRVNRYIDRSDE